MSKDVPRVKVARRPPDTNYNLTLAVLERVPWFRERLLSWFIEYGRGFPWREPGRTPYEILIAEILLQRTTAASVARIYMAFLKRYPSWHALAKAPVEELQQFLRPVGLWQQKAQIFGALAQAVNDRGGEIPASRLELEQLAGVGQYIASAVLTTVYKQPEPFVDVNMARVIERFFGPRKLADIRHDPYLQTLARKVVMGPSSLQMNWAILDFGALVCKPGRPLCERCPLQAQCLFYDSIMK